MTISVARMGSYNAIAEYVMANQVDELQGVFADEIVAALGVSKSTAYKVLKMPGFYRTVRPVTQPYAYSFNPADGIINTTLSVRKQQAEIYARSVRGRLEFKTELGLVKLTEVNPVGFIFDHLLEFAKATPNVGDKAVRFAELTQEMQDRINAFVSGTPEAFDASADQKWLISLAELASACRTISELSQEILNHELLRSPEYWRLFAKDL